jgi:hypothetical protein
MLITLARMDRKDIRLHHLVSASIDDRCTSASDTSGWSSNRMQPALLHLRYHQTMSATSTSVHTMRVVRRSVRRLSASTLCAGPDVGHAVR